MNVPARPKAPTLRTLAAVLAAQGLRPLIDADLALVRADCPHCRAEEVDPLGLYRPVQVVPRGQRVITRCDACGATTTTRSGASR